MKLLLLFTALLLQQVAYGQRDVRVSFQNDYQDVYHLALIVYTPDGLNQTRVSNLTPGQVKEYTFPSGTQVFVAEPGQEAYAMKGNDIKAAGVKPTFTVGAGTSNLTIALSSLPKPGNTP
jgi:hypothetical protein